MDDEHYVRLQNQFFANPAQPRISIAGLTRDSPVVAAAGLAESSVLLKLIQESQQLAPSDRSRCVLDQVTVSDDGRYWTTPLLRAIEFERSASVQLLLQHGANPNGADKESQKQLFVPESDDDMKCPYFYMPTPTDAELCANARIGQDSDLTADDIEDRRTNVLPFWFDYDLELDLSDDDAKFHSVIRASSLSSPAILDQLLQAGADVSVWQAPTALNQHRNQNSLPPSALSISTPLHSAIANGRTSMIRALLDRGFDPNAKPLLGEVPFSPAQYAILMGQAEAYSIISAHARYEVDMLTLTYGVHCLHLAAANLRIDLVNLIGVSQHPGPVTALGQSLLHIACLPYDETAIQTYAPKIRESIHDTRKLGMSTRRSSEERTLQPNGQLVLVPRPLPHGTGIQSAYWTDLAQQDAFCRFLIRESGSRQVALADVHGNTALHYLSSVQQLKTELVSWLRSIEGVEGVWQSARNVWGHTPRDLWEDNVLAQASLRNVNSRSCRGYSHTCRRRGRGR